MTASTPNPYGIPIVKRSAKRAPTKLAPAVGDTNKATMTSAKKVIAEHREVIKALAKR